MLEYDKDLCIETIEYYRDFYDMKEDYDCVKSGRNNLAMLLKNIEDNMYQIVELNNIIKEDAPPPAENP